MQEWRVCKDKGILHSKMTTYTNVKKEQLKALQDHGFWFDEARGKYEVARLRGKRAILILFTTNKLLVQGKEQGVKEVEEILYKLRIGKKVHPIKFVKEKGIVIGSDEALKGDSFGGIVVAAVRADEQQRQDLLLNHFVLNILGKVQLGAD